MSHARGESVVRFGRLVRLEHGFVILLFLVLLLTGLPQKWPDVAASRALIDAFGGIYLARTCHRVAGLVFAFLVSAHIGRVVLGVLARKFAPTLLFTVRDFSDAIDNLRYYLGRKETPPRFGRYDYRQKFEYWGLVFGSMVMVGSGFVLYFPLRFATWLPAELIPVAKVMHSNEALLAFLIVLIWHMYGAHLNPEVFPADLSIFNGRISKERLKAEHPLEYEEIFGPE
jgi:formate dehydrogenase gamma subunit